MSPADEEYNAISTNDYTKYCGRIRVLIKPHRTILMDFSWTLMEPTISIINVVTALPFQHSVLIDDNFQITLLT